MPVLAITSAHAGVEACVPMCRIKAKQDKEAGIAAQLNEKDKKSKKKK